jgi:hypothetical protein
MGKGNRVQLIKRGGEKVKGKLGIQEGSYVFNLVPRFKSQL